MLVLKIKEVATGQGMQTSYSVGEARELEPLEGAWPSQHLILDF